MPFQYTSSVGLYQLHRDGSRIFGKAESTKGHIQYNLEKLNVDFSKYVWDALNSENETIHDLFKYMSKITLLCFNCVKETSP